jgi:phage gpG-like protein
LTIKADFSGADKKMQALFRMEGATKKALTAAMASTVRRAQQNVTNSILRVQTGHLKRNIGGQVKETTKGFFEVGIGTGNLVGRTQVIYASVHEFGATIRAKRFPYLCFPISGVGPWRGKSAKRWVKVKQVTIPARHWLSRSIQESEGYFMQALSPKNLLREMDYPERED